MSDTVILQKKEELPEEVNAVEIIPEQEESNLPTMAELQTQLAESSKLVDDIVLKKYLHKLTDLEIIPLTDELKQISDIRLFKITEMVYQKDEYSTYKFASVFNSVQNLNCGVFIVADSNGEKTDFYMGVRSLDDKRTTKSLKDTLRNALIGQFPGVKSTDLLDPQAEAFLAECLISITMERWTPLSVQPSSSFSTRLSRRTTTTSMRTMTICPKMTMRWTMLLQTPA